MDDDFGAQPFHALTTDAAHALVGALRVRARRQPNASAEASALLEPFSADPLWEATQHLMAGVIAAAAETDQGYIDGWTRARTLLKRSIRGAAAQGPLDEAAVPLYREILHLMEDEPVPQEATLLGRPSARLVQRLDNDTLHHALLHVLYVTALGQPGPAEEVHDLYQRILDPVSRHIHADLAHVGQPRPALPSQLAGVEMDQIERRLMVPAIASRFCATGIHFAERDHTIDPWQGRVDISMMLSRAPVFEHYPLLVDAVRFAIVDLHEPATDVEQVGLVRRAAHDAAVRVDTGVDVSDRAALAAVLEALGQAQAGPDGVTVPGLVSHIPAEEGIAVFVPAFAHVVRAAVIAKAESGGGDPSAALDDAQERWETGWSPRRDA